MPEKNNCSAELLALIDKIGNQSGKYKLAIFCGAGVSYNSGLPLAHDLVKTILKSVGLSESEISTILNSNLPFEAFIQTLKDEVDITDILDIFSKGEPNTNHYLIAELIFRGYIKTVLTTNFDLHLENALIHKGLKEYHDFDIYTREVDFEKIEWNSNKIQIIKIHGCISNKEEIAVTMKDVARHTVSRSKEKAIKSFFSNQINTDVIILGYSCSDLFDISPQIETIDRDMCQVYLLEHTNSNCIIEDISIKKHKNPFNSFIGKRIYTNVDSFIKQVWTTILPTEYRFMCSSTSWQKNIEIWLNKAIKYSSGITYQIAGRLLYDIGKYSSSVNYYERGIYIAQMEGNQIFFIVY